MIYFKRLTLQEFMFKFWGEGCDYCLSEIQIRLSIELESHYLYHNFHFPPLNFSQNRIFIVSGQFNGSLYCFNLTLKYELTINPSLSVLISVPAETILAINMSLRN